MINLKEYFVDSENRRVHTQNIERLWRGLKAHVKRPGIVPRYLYQYLARYLFVRDVLSKERLHTFLAEAARLYPPVHGEILPQAEEDGKTLSLGFSEIAFDDSETLLEKIFQNLLSAVKKHVLANGVTPQNKGSSGRNKKALTVTDVERVVLFLRGFADTHALAMPGQMKGIHRTDLRLLPSAFTKVYVHEQYKKAQESSGLYSVSLSSFKREWARYCPDIYVSKPMTDLCWTCQRNTSRINSGHMDLEMKQAVMDIHTLHLQAVTAERSYYQECVVDSKAAAVRALFPSSDLPLQL
ncbi:hypothetical protein ElyMa_005065100 [Elysia marginata]|uniref:Integrase SAM-like N-terminal domain-containing protein n=1 Tax=Elysia marginata TaxID=1093978 RepID=A0AAV4JG60_9GAST|nr:hypothetical protein ElyMa_005065100 [Elysia marginata]